MDRPDSRRKGAEGERLADHLGVEITRNLLQSRQGGHDLSGLPVALEAKRYSTTTPALPGAAEPHRPAPEKLTGFLTASHRKKVVWILATKIRKNGKGILTGILTAKSAKKGTFKIS